MQGRYACGPGTSEVEPASTCAMTSTTRAGRTAASSSSATLTASAVALEAAGRWDNSDVDTSALGTVRQEQCREGAEGYDLFAVVKQLTNGAGVQRQCLMPAAPYE